MSVVNIGHIGVSISTKRRQRQNVDASLLEMVAAVPLGDELEIYEGIRWA
jgi:hypothetical protein